MRIEKLAPTGEGVVRGPDGVGFIDRALPGELVETTLYEKRRRFWRGSLRRVLEPSPDRVDSAHSGCAGCDWAHYAPEPARRAKGELFLETMQRIGHLEPALFGAPIPPVEPSQAGYRLRLRLHASGRGASARLGYFAPGTHRVVGAEACEAISPSTRAGLAEVAEAIAESGASVAEIAILEDVPGTRRLIRVSADDGEKAAEAGLAERLSSGFEGVRVETLEGAPRAERGRRRLPLEVASRPFLVSVDSFFQGNRHLVGRLAEAVRELASEVPAGSALDAFGGVGLFAGPLLSAGHEVTSVELDRGAVEDARATRALWPDRDHWALEAASLADSLRARESGFDVVVADPPRTGLETDLARELARRTRRLFLYVSCDPATLARDLPALRAEGLEIRSTQLYDLFAFTHRVEALVALERRS